MLSLPISQNTFKRSFLSGNGEVEIHTDQDAWARLVAEDLPFDPKTARLADVKFKLGATKNVMLGAADRLKLGISGNVEASHQIELIWPKAGDGAEGARGLAPGEGQVLARLSLRGQADASATGSAPIGPLKTTFGVTAGAALSCEVLRMHSAQDGARQIIEGLFGAWRLPQQIDGGEAIPAGEVVAAALSGYLTVNSQLNYGYSLAGSREIEIGKLDLNLDYALKLAAGVTASYRLAGEFDIEARAGSSPGFVRLTVHKSRDAKFNFGADFGVVAEEHLQGLPNTADEFLEKAFGAHAEQAAEVLKQAAEYSDLDKLEGAAGKLMKGAIDDWGGKMMGKALTHDTFQEFLGKALEAIDTYNSIDQKVIHMYEDFVAEKLPKLAPTLDRLAKVTSPDALKELEGKEHWDLISLLLGSGVYEILVDSKAFERFATLVQDARSLLVDEGKQAVRDLVGVFKGAFPLNGLMEKMKEIKTPEQLAQLGEGKLQALAEHLLGKAFTEIRKHAGDELKALHAALEKVESFKDKYYEKLKEATYRSFQAQVSLAFARASVSDRLLDIEVDVSSPEGRELARLAAGGDFAGALAKYQSKLVRINKGLFTHEVSSSTHLQVNLFGYKAESFSQLIARTEEAIETHEGGLVHVYTTKAQLDERKTHGGELTASTFVLAMAASAEQSAGARELLIRTVPKMSAQYDLLEEDDKTSVDEMRQILDLAVITGVLGDREAFLEDLRRQFPQGLGKVSARYVTRYEAEAVRAAFGLGERARGLAIETMRAFIAAKYLPSRALAPLALAYLNPANGELFYRLGNPNAFAAEPIPLAAPLKQSLATMYLIEQRFVTRLLALDEAIGRGGVSIDELSKAARQFVEMADDLSFGRANTFFVVFDRLAAEGSGGAAPRQSALMLEITPPGGEKVTKILTPAATVPSAFRAGTAS